MKARVGIIGLGAVGTGVLRLLEQPGGFFSSRLNIDIRVTANKAPFADVLKEARALGYAEADPSLDVEGLDSAHKLAILAALSCRKFVDYREMSVSGISHVTSLDLELAAELGYAVKLSGVLEPYPDGSLFAHVYHALLAKEHPLASIQGVSNAGFVKGSAAGSHNLSGPGAGGTPTASAVVGDLVHVCRQMSNNLFSEHTVNCMPREADVRDALAKIHSFPFVAGKTQMIRIYR